MKNIGYQFIIVILSLINIFLNFETLEKKDFYNVRVTEGYTNVGLPTHPNMSGFTSNNLPIQSQPVQNSMNVPPVLKEEAYMSAAFDYSLGDARLIGDAGVMKTDIALTINPIEGNELPPLNQGMVNVTGDNSGYRMLPKGMVFRNDINIILPYDSTLLPMGFTPNDIKTYFYHDTYKRWIEIERDSIDENNQLVISKVNHFTDFINAIIKTPEMPETASFAPTQMNDIKAANPLEGFSLMQPPTANNMGTANISYPLWIPNGRKGMQPDLTLTYNSSGNNGLLGQGWDINIPMISVETQWGVPRFDPSKETEIYLLDGQQLATKSIQGTELKYDPLPNRRAVWASRNASGVTRFYKRVEGGFEIIERYGNTPKNYWWKVTDKNGTQYYYGKKQNIDELDPNSVLKDINGNVAKWGLTKVEDIHGNNICYHYNCKNTISEGSKLQISDISYTGFGTNEGHFKIKFLTTERSSIGLKDKYSNGRYGCIEIMDDILTHIIVYSGEFAQERHIIKGYAFQYEVGGFEKTRLLKFAEFSNDLLSNNNWGEMMDQNAVPYFDDVPYDPSNFIILNTFEYYDEPENIFEDNYTSIPVQNVLIPEYGSNTVMSPIGSGFSSGYGLGAALTVGFGENPAHKGLSVGGNYNRDEKTSQTKSSLMDIDGDGLVDRVFSFGDKLYYQKHKINNLTHSFENPIEIFDGYKLNKEKSSSDSWGGEAILAYLGLGLTVGYTFNTSKSSLDQYFTDFNADGLPDLVISGNIFFNKLINNAPTFEINTSETVLVGGGCGTEFIMNDVPVDENMFLPGDMVITSSYDKINDKMIYDTTYSAPLVEKFPDFDAVKVWIAPYTGEINLESYCQLTSDLMDARIGSRVFDGVKISIQHNGEIINSAHLTPQGDISNYEYFDNYRVKKGDRLYFRIESKDKRAYDKVFWNPRILYLNTEFGDADTTIIDPNGEKIYVFDSKEDYLVYSDRKYHIALENQSAINIKTTLILEESLTADVEARVYRNNQIIQSEYIPEGNYGTYFINVNNLNVYENDSIWFELWSNTNVKWKSVYWDLGFYYTSTSIPNFQPIVTSNGISDTLIYYRNLIPIYKAYPNPVIPTGIFNYSQNIDFIDPVIQIEGITDNSDFIFSIKDDYSTILEIPINLSNGNNDLVLQNYPTLLPGNNYYFNLYSLDYTQCENSSMPICYFNNESVSVGVLTNTKIEDLEFGPLYRNWGQFSYQKEVSTDIEINEDILHFNIDKVKIVDETYPNFHDIFGIDATEGVIDFDPVEQNFLMMEPDYLNNRWFGYGNITYISPDTISNTFSTINEIDATEFPIAVPVPGSFSCAPLLNSYGESNCLNLKIAVDFGLVPQGVKDDLLGGKLQSLMSFLPNGLNDVDINQGYSFTWGWNHYVSGFTDMNGDRYPDVISEEQIQYSKPQGGLSSLKKGYKKEDDNRVNKTSYNGGGTSFGASYGISSAARAAEKVGKTHKYSSSVGVSGTVNKNSDKCKYKWIDINGDGIEDRILENGLVYIGIGYDFLDYSDFSFSNLQEGKSTSAGASFSVPTQFNFLETSIAGGVGFGTSSNYSKIMTLDINGDGLTDMLELNENILEPDKPFKIYYNLGNSFSSPVFIESNKIENINKTFSNDKNVNLALSAGFVLGSIPIKFVVNGQGNYSWNYNNQDEQFVDMNADGLVDYVTIDASNNLKVLFNQTGKTNLLKNVNNFVGGSFSIAYKLSENSYNNPSRSYLMSEIILDDGHYGDAESYSLNGVQIEVQVLRFEYENPYYDRYERTSYGYEIVRTINPNANLAALFNNIYRRTTSKYYNDSYKFKGIKYYELLQDGESNKFIEKFYNYASKEIATGVVIPPAQAHCYGESYPALNEEITNYYEGSSTIKCSTKKTYTHGAFGNVTNYYDEGVVNKDGDEIQAVITYHPDQDNKNLTGIPSSINVTDVFYNKLMRKRETTINNIGDVTEIRTYNGLQIAKNNFTYDIYGNITSILKPEDNNLQRQYYTFVYDNNIFTYPITIKDESLNLTSTNSYNYDFGKPTLTTDINGKYMVYEYDKFGRTTKIISPNESNYTIKFQYWLTNSSNSMTNVPYAITDHFDIMDPANPIQTILFTDGFGKVVQTKKDVEIDGIEKSVVSGYVKYDLYGRVIKTYDPIIENKQTSNYSINTAIDNNNPTIVTYDILDRELTTTYPNSTISNKSYSIVDKEFVTTITDPKLVVTKNYNDARGLNIKVHNIPEDVATVFKYNALGELTQSIDPDNHSTYYFYDMFGQITKRIHPDAGIDSTKYDLAGHFINKFSQNQLNDQTSIDYIYNYSQLKEIRYPKYPENNVKYFYGDQNALFNRKGRVYAIEDASGRQEFSYGNMGEVIEKIHTFVLPNETNLYTFKTSFVYDSWNRLIQMTYPDGEILNYTYNEGGKLKTMASQYNNTPTLYISDIKYNKFEQKTDIVYGNLSESHYTYNNMQRLCTLVTENSNGTLQNIVYSFDNANNIETIANSAVRLNNGLGGEYNQQFQYDDLYRLTTSNGSFDKRPTYFNYTLQMSYTPDGRILNKQLNANQLLPSTYGYINNNNTYSYNTQNHKLIQVKDTSRSYNSYFGWDANGNMTSQDNRFLCWDDINRLLGVTDPTYTSYYSYDHKGDRFYKLPGQNSYMNVNGNQYKYTTLSNPTLYVEGYLVATPQGYTKHYYNGSERVASSIGLGGISTISTQLTLSTSWTTKKEESNAMMTRLFGNCLAVTLSSKTKPITMNLYRYLNIQTGSVSKYFYHTNHLGSSSWITDGNGNAIQHLQNLPFGEDWVDERSTTWNSRYTFTGKEKDTETGYGYFGARYYDSGLSIWLSVDPMSDKYPNMSPYNYCENNPVILVDPDGKLPVPQLIGAGVGMIFEYGSQVVNNYYTYGEFSLTKKIDIFDITVAGVEGFYTCGTSAIKSVATKAIVTVAAETVKNIVDTKGNGVEINTNVTEVVVNTAFNILLDNVSTTVTPNVFKTKFLEAQVPTPKQAVKKARVEAKAKGSYINRTERTSIQEAAARWVKESKEVDKQIKAKAPTWLIGEPMKED